MNGTASTPSLAVGELLSEAWAVFKANAGLLVGAFAIFIVISAGANGLTYKIGGIGGIILNGPMMLGYIALVMGLLKKQPVEIGTLFSGFQRFLPAFLANLLMSIFTGIGLILCVIPGLFVSMIYLLTYFYMLEKNLDFWPSMEASRTKIMGNLGSWIVLWLVLIAINIVGLIPCGLGLLVTGPLSLLTLGLAYQRVEGGATQTSAV